jgi:hypothetical protein
MYQVLEFGFKSDLVEAVNEAMLNGWTPLGAPYVFQLSDETNHFTASFYKFPGDRFPGGEVYPGAGFYHESSVVYGQAMVK